MQFCSQRQLDKINPSLGDIIVFLTELHEAGLGYSAINTAKSMLSSIISVIHKQYIGPLNHERDFSFKTNSSQDVIHLEYYNCVGFFKWS